MQSFISLYARYFHYLSLSLYIFFMKFLFQCFCRKSLLCTHARTHTRTRTHAHAHTHARTRTHAHTYTHTRAHARSRSIQKVISMSGFFFSIHLWRTSEWTYLRKVKKRTLNVVTFCNSQEPKLIAMCGLSPSSPVLLENILAPRQ